MNLDDKIVAVNRLAEAGFPDDVWPVAFVKGCNLRCPYCLNVSIADPKPGMKTLSIEELLGKLDDWGEDGVILSGGECCMSAGLVSRMAYRLESHGKKMGVATNGMFPDELAELVKKNRNLSFIGLDCKFGPSDVFNPDLSVKSGMLGGSSDMADKMFRSLGIVWDWHENCQDARSEIRTTLYPPLVGEGDIMVIGRLIHPKSKWFLQQYRKNIGFDGKGNDVEPYPDEEVTRLMHVARWHCSAPVDIRWP